MQNPVVSREDWLKARLDLLEAEKAFTRERDALTRRRQGMPWMRVDKDYRFEGPQGPLSMADLFDGRSQLIVYHFMLGPGWEQGCPSCSFWADNFEGIPVHLGHRDVTFTAVSRAALPEIEAYRGRMGWTFPWVSSNGSDFSFDFDAAFTPEQMAAGRAVYNYRPKTGEVTDLVGVSVFYRTPAGEPGAGGIFHTYSCYGRGVDMLNGAYHYLDLVPKGRDEDGLDFTQAWVRRHDEY